MNDTFSWSFGAGRLHLAGRIDENADLAALVSQIPAEGARIELSELTRINSIGVRASRAAWIAAFMRSAL